MASQEQRKQKTQRQLINAAKKLFDKHGFEAVTVAQIVKVANVAKGTFYQYYETKVDVLADVARDEGVDKMKAALAAVEQGASALETLQLFIAAQCQWFEANAHLAEALIMSALKSVGDEEKLDQQRHSRHFQLALMKLGQAQGEIRDDIDAMELSKMISGALVMSVLVWSKNPKKIALYPSMQASLAVFLDGVRA